MGFGKVSSCASQFRATVPVEFAYHLQGVEQTPVPGLLPFPKARGNGVVLKLAKESPGVSASTFLICTGPRDRAQAPENKLHCQRGALVGRKSRQRKMPRNPGTLNLPRTPRSLPVLALQQPRGFPNGSLCSFLLWSRDKWDTEQPAFAPGA